MKKKSIYKKYYVYTKDCLWAIPTKDIVRLNNNHFMTIMSGAVTEQSPAVLRVAGSIRVVPCVGFCAMCNVGT